MSIFHKKDKKNTGKEFLNKFWNGKEAANNSAKPLYVVKVGEDSKNNGFYYVTMTDRNQLLCCKNPDQTTKEITTSRIQSEESGDGYVVFTTASGSKYRVADLLSRYGNEKISIRYGFEIGDDIIYDDTTVLANNFADACKIVEFKCPYEIVRVIEQK